MDMKRKCGKQRELTSRKTMREYLQPYKQINSWKSMVYGGQANGIFH